MTQLTTEQIDNLNNLSGNEIISNITELEDYCDVIDIIVPNDVLINDLGYVVDLDEEEIAEMSKIQINPNTKSAKWLEVAGELDENTIPLDYSQLLEELPTIVRNAETIEIN